GGMLLPQQGGLGSMADIVGLGNLEGLGLGSLGIGGLGIGALAQDTNPGDVRGSPAAAAFEGLSGIPSDAQLTPLTLTSEQMSSPQVSVFTSPLNASNINSDFPNASSLNNADPPG